MRRVNQLTILLALAAATGCTTLKVSKVQYDKASDSTIRRPDGILYSLPKPILKVQPLSDGTIDVQVEYLPDREHTYVISADSKLAKHDLTVEVENGLLKKVYWGPDSTDVASKALEAAAAAEKARLDAAAKREEKAEAKVAEAIKAKETALAAAIKERDAAELELALKEAERDFLIEQGKPVPDDLLLAIRVAQRKVELAQEKVDQAQADLESETERSLAVLGASAADPPLPKAPGPVFYSIVETPGEKGPPPTAPRVRLQAVVLKEELKDVKIDGKNQFEFQTATIQKTSPAAPKLSPRGGFEPTVPITLSSSYQSAEKNLKIAEARLKALVDNLATEEQIDKAEADRAAAFVILELERKKAYWLTIDSTATITKLGDGLGSPNCELQNPTQQPQCEQESSTSLVARLPYLLPKGDYVLKVHYLYSKKGKLESTYEEIHFKSAQAPWGNR